jgi:hypothetical protein
MKKFLISEEEKRRILGMHVDKGYSSLMNEQGVKPTPPAPVDKVQRATEINNEYFRSNPVGQKLAKNPAFVDFINKNNINIQQANLQVEANNSQAIMQRNGKNYLVNFLSFDGNIPSDIVEKYQTAYKSVSSKINELDSNPQIKKNLCFDVPLMKGNPNGNKQFCKPYWDDFNAFVKSSGYEGFTSLKLMQDFLTAAPKWKVA